MIYVNNFSQEINFEVKSRFISRFTCLHDGQYRRYNYRRRLAEKVAVDCTRALGMAAVGRGILNTSCKAVRR